jgi:uncharacterized membrane protein
MTGYIHLGPTVLASFAASLVEFVEALTVILAVGVVRGWRWALIGTAAAVVVLMTMVAAFGGSLVKVPLRFAQFVIGTLLLMFGLRWLRKAILRSVGVIALHDEAATFARETESLREHRAPATTTRWDPLAFTTAFKIVMLEGIEVVFIVIAIGASSGLLLPAACGALAAFLLVAALGFGLHRPLSNIPENTLKFGVGIMLAAFGTFWVGEGAGLRWPAGDGSLLILIASFLLLAQAAIVVARSAEPAVATRSKQPRSGQPKGMLVAMVRELWSLFVDDGSLALGILVWTAMAWWSDGQTPLPMTAQCVIFALGVGGVLVYSLRRSLRSERATP